MVCVQFEHNKFVSDQSSRANLVDNTNYVVSGHTKLKQPESDRFVLCSFSSHNQLMEQVEQH